MRGFARLWASERLGRRGLFLTIFALAYLIIGLKSLVEPLPDDGRFVLYALLPSTIRGVLWIVPAGAALIAAVRPSARDGYGFVALTLPATVVAFSYLWSWVAYFLGATDWSFGWASAATWLLLLALILVVSGWGEDRARPNPNEGDIE